MLLKFQMAKFRRAIRVTKKYTDKMKNRPLSGVRGRLGGENLFANLQVWG